MSGDYKQRMEELKQAAARLFELASSEDEVRNLEQLAADELTYQATLAQVKYVDIPEDRKLH